MLTSNSDWILFLQALTFYRAWGGQVTDVISPDACRIAGIFYPGHSKELAGAQLKWKTKNIWVWILKSSRALSVLRELQAQSVFI